MSWNKVGKKKQGDSATQSLLPDELKTANKKIESLLSQYQNVLRELREKVSRPILPFLSLTTYVRASVVEKLSGN